MGIIEIAGEQDFDFALFLPQIFVNSSSQLFRLLISNESGVQVAIKTVRVDGLFNNPAIPDDLRRHYLDVVIPVRPDLYDESHFFCRFFIQRTEVFDDFSDVEIGVEERDVDIADEAVD